MNAEYLNTSIPFSAGGLLMNVEDILSWHLALVGNRLLKKETLSLAQTRFTLKDGSKTEYGFGWELPEVFGNPAIGHTGSINGYASMEIYFDKEDVFVSILCNRINVNSNELMRLAACLATSNPVTREINLPASVFKDYSGIYKFKLDQPSTIHVFEKDGKYFMQDSRSPKAWRMHFTSNTEFYCFQVFPNNHIFTKDASGKVDGFLIKAPGYESRITKIE